MKPIQCPSGVGVFRLYVKGMRIFYTNGLYGSSDGEEEFLSDSISLVMQWCASHRAVTP